jgi:Ca2+-binding RTX toxin-like protein
MGGRTGRLMRRCWLASLAAVASLAIPSAAGAATTTIGQLAPSPEATCNANVFDQLQASVTSGTSYAVPADGTITSWSHNAVAGSDHQLKFKVFRKLAGENEYQVVAHDGPRDLTEGSLNTFGVSIPVRTGDVIGINDGQDPIACIFAVPGETGIRLHSGDLADGASDDFSTSAGFRLNLSAVVTTPDPLTTPSPLTTSNPTTTTCKGSQATIVGTASSDAIVGTDKRDVIAALEGNDKVSGLNGNDLICGAKGKDTLIGGPGGDNLLGQTGRDTLKGGAAKDLCKGGKGEDSASKCEVEKSI